jgi:hypothetical protein
VPRRHAREQPWYLDTRLINGGTRGESLRDEDSYAVLVTARRWHVHSRYVPLCTCKSAPVRLLYPFLARLLIRVSAKPTQTLFFV